jgi:hypothetical protein
MLSERSGQAANAEHPARQNSQNIRATEYRVFILAGVVGKEDAKRMAYCAGISL